MKWIVHVVIALSALLSICATSLAQDGPTLSGRDGDTVEADRSVDPKGAAKARVTSLCSKLFPPKGSSVERNSHANYPEWVKRLICTYITADFSTAEVRTAYVKDVLKALRANGPPERTWGFSNDSPIVHIVTEDPAHIDPIPGTNKFKVFRIRSSLLKRSLKKPSASVIGFNEKLFTVPAAKTEEVANKRIPDAEEFILRTLAYAIVADMLAGTTNALSKNNLDRRVKKGLTDFKNQIMKLAKLPKKLGVSGFGPRPPGVGPRPRPPAIEQGKNVHERNFVAGKVFRAVDRKGKRLALGLTRAAMGIDLFLPKPRAVPGSDLENIEPYPKFENAFFHFLVDVRLRTIIAIDVFEGVPTRNGAIRVQGRSNKDCTAAIKTHEFKHVGQYWDAWKAHAIDRILNDLRNRRFGKGVKKTVTVEIASKTNTVFGASMPLQYLDIVAQYRFPLGNLRSVESAQKALLNDYSESKLRTITRNACNEADRAAREFHRKVERALDANCNPTRDGRSFRFGEPAKCETVKFPR